ncbi:MAG: ExbD/TolR family protein [Pseudomonadota bacterium]
MAVSAYSASDRDARIAEINITPLVDVMLVLLVIFMIAAPAVTGTLSTRLPADSQRVDAVPPRAELSVDASGGFALDGRALTRDALQAELAALARRSPRAVVEIAASREADYQAFATALSTARAGGIENITFRR